MNVKKNFLYNLIYQFFVIILPLITVPYVSRILGAEGVGEYSYSASYAQYFIIIGMIGISIYGNRQIAYVKKDKEKLSKEFWNIYTLQFVTTILSLILYLIVFVGLNPNNRILYLVQAITIIATVFDISWFFIGYEDMKSVVIRNSITKIIGALLIFLLVKNLNDVILYALIMGTTTFIGQLIMWVSVPKLVKFNKPNLKDSLGHLKPALSLFISQLAIQVYVLLDKTMLGIMSSTTEVGFYENSQKTLKLVLTLITALGTVMLPRMSALYSEGNMEEFKKMIYKAFSFVNFMAFPMVLGLIAISDGFSLWFYGENFIGVENLLKIGSLILLAISWSNILGMQVMIPMKKEKQFTISVTVGAVVNFVLNLILISNLKSVGTTISSVIAEMAVTGTQLYLLRDLVNIRKILKTVYKPVIGAISMYLAITFLTTSFEVGIIYTVMQVILGCLVYAVVMYFLKDEFLNSVLNMIKEKLKVRGRIDEKI